jgi:predicted transcriptional regulator
MQQRSFSWENILEILDAEVLIDNNWLTHPISSVNASDLMSDILSSSKRKSLLLTGLTNPQTIRTAEMVEIAAVCFVFGKVPPKETMELATKNQVPLIRTDYSLFDACGRLYCAGMVGCTGNKDYSSTP